MLIPRGVLALRKIAHPEKTRFAMNGVMFDRAPDGKAVAVATDGKRLIEATWDDKGPRDSFPALDGFELGGKITHAALVPSDTLANLERAVKGSKVKPDMRFAALEEPSVNGTVRLATNVNGVSPSVATVPGLDGVFPPYQDAMPKPDDKPRIRIGINATYLAEIAETLAAIRESGKPDAVVLEIKDASSAIVVKPCGPNHSGVETRAVLMPIFLDNAGEPTNETPTENDTSALEAARAELEAARKETESVRAELEAVKRAVRAAIE